MSTNSDNQVQLEKIIGIDGLKHFLTKIQGYSEGYTESYVSEYAPKKDGTNAIGNWPINIIGTAGNADKLNNEPASSYAKITDLESYVLKTEIPSLTDCATKSWVGDNYLSKNGGTVNGSITAPSFIGNLTGTASGNLPLNGGAMAKNSYIDWGNTDGYEDYSAYSNGFKILGYNTVSGDYRGGIHVGVRYGWQLTREAYFDTFQIRNYSPSSASWGDWKTLAFTDSNVASATKLQTPRTIWGQSFDGTGDIRGALTVHGYANTGSISKVSDLAEGLVVGASDTRTSWGMTFWTEGSGKGFIQQQSFTPENTTYALCFQPLGGNVAIGATIADEKLHVHGNGKFTGSITAPSFIGNLMGNADSATKIQTPRTIWGQSFDGTSDITGVLTTSEDISFNTEKYNDISWSRGFIWRNDSLEYGNLCYVKIGGERYINIAHGAYNSILGLRVSANGNVAIGGTSADEKLHVHGNGKFTGSITAPSFIGNLMGHADSASKVTNALTVGSKIYDGSSAVKIEASDLGLASALKYCGKTTTALTDGATTNPIVIDGSNHTAVAGCTVISNDNNKEFVFNGTSWELLGDEGSYKVKQDAISSPSASGNTTAFIDTITQDANGKITATKKNVDFSSYVPKSGNTTISGTLTANGFVGALTGNAATATALTVKSKGSVTNPIYWDSNGQPVACTYSLNKSVPSDAVFTDTKNTAGSTNTSSKIYLIGATSQAANPQTYSHDTAYVGTDGCIYSTNFITTSDRRMKENIEELQDCSKSLELGFYEFDYKTGGHSAGHVAQDVREVYPAFVHGEETETNNLSVDYNALHTMQIKALKDKVETLETENKELHERLEKLEALIEKLV